MESPPVRRPRPIQPIGISKVPEMIIGCEHQVQDSDAVGRKAQRISQLFASMVDSSPSQKSSGNAKEELSKDSPSKTLPRSQDEFYQRVSSFQPGLWTVHQISPLECASWGWKLLEKDVLQCVTCQEVICAILPDRKDKVAYEKFFDILKGRLETNHRDACGWLYNRSPKEFMEPLVINAEELRNLKNSVQTLAMLNSALPFLNNSRLTAALGADDEVIKGLLKSDDVDEEAKISSVLLVLCGWSKGRGPYLRCNVCRRLVGLWSLINIADELKNSNESSKTSLDTASRKRKLSENDDATEEVFDNNKRVTRKSPRKLKDQESNDMPTPKRMKTRSQGDEMEDEDGDDCSEKREYLLITSPSTQVEKVEKKYFTPLEEHRHWCPWIAKVDTYVNEDEDEDDDPPKGFCVVTDQVRALLQMSNKRKSLSKEKCVENVDGLRIIRNLLDEVSRD